MNAKILTIISRIFGVLFCIGGLIFVITTITLIVGAGTAGYGAMIIKQMGESIGNFPGGTTALVIGYTLCMSVLYFANAVALFTFKKWVLKTFIPFIILAGISATISLLNGVQSAIFELMWVVVYAAFAYSIKKHKHIYVH